MGNGRVTQVMGPVIDVRFEHNEVPEINNALIIEVPKNDGTFKLTLEVALQLGDDVVRTIAMDSTDGVQRGMQVVNTGKDISVPVGEETLGRVFNVLGETIDLNEKIDKPLNQLSPRLMQYLETTLSDKVTQLIISQASKHLSTIMQKINLRKLVEDQINTFDLDYIEKLIIEIANKELKLITLLGFILGGMIGLFQGLIAIFV